MLKFLSLFILGFPLALLAGGSDGGGGNGVVCYDLKDSKKVISVELLDFYESRILEGYKISDRSGDYIAIYQQAMQKSASKFVSTYLQQGLTLSKGFKFLPQGVRLRPIDDSGEIFIPENCKVEQIANFQGPSRIFIVSDFWNLLSETNKAGLLLHEYLWWEERSGGYKSSARARRNVARFFADDYQFKKIDHKVKKGDLYCNSGRFIGGMNTEYRNSFFVSVLDEDNCRISFEYLNGTMAFSQYEVIHDGCPVFLNFEPNEFTWRTYHEVNAYPDQVVSHELSLVTKTEVEGNVHKRSRQIQISNLEFPGFDDVEEDLGCREIQENDLKNPWWE